MKELGEILKNVDENDINKVDWTNIWSKKYSVLSSYKKEVNTLRYKKQIREMLEDLKMRYGYQELDAMLVLKDILYSEWKENKSHDKIQ